MSSTEQDVASPAAAVLERRPSRTTQEKRKQQREGRGGEREEGSYFADFLSTAAVWCVPFCLDCSVPSVYSINFKRTKDANGGAGRWGGEVMTKLIPL